MPPPWTRWPAPTSSWAAPTSWPGCWRPRSPSPARAQRAWEDLLRATPSDSEALEALSRRYAEVRDWRALVAVLERRIPLAPDTATSVQLALERARIFEVELDTRSEAVATLEQI